jgi:hypothetical protein
LKQHRITKQNSFLKIEELRVVKDILLLWRKIAMKLLTLLSANDESITGYRETEGKYQKFRLARDGDLFIVRVGKVSSFRSYEHFSNVQAKFDDYIWFPAEPIELPEFTYEVLKQLWFEIFEKQYYALGAW